MALPPTRRPVRRAPASPTANGRVGEREGLAVGLGHHTGAALHGLWAGTYGTYGITAELRHQPRLHLSGRL